MVQNFREIAGNPININFRDKNFVIATFFRDCCRRAPLPGRIRFSRPQLHIASSTFRCCEKSEEKGPKKEDDTIRVPVMRRVRGFHVYRSVWTLSCSREASNLHDPFAVKVLKTER